MRYTWTRDRFKFPKNLEELNPHVALYANSLLQLEQADEEARRERRDRGPADVCFYSSLYIGTFTPALVYF